MTEDSAFLLGALKFTHASFFKLLKRVSAERFEKVFSPTAPPIGWHVWHLARFSDIFLATFPHHDQIWDTQNLESAWGLSAESLGGMRAGMQMEHDIAVQIAGRGQEEIIAYAKGVFRPLEDEILALNGQFSLKRPGLRRFEVIDGRVIDAEPPMATVYEDIIFHYAHVNRHLGMIEALLGVDHTQGTASV